MNYFEYKFVLSEGVNPYNTHAVTTHLLGKGVTERFSASGSGQELILRTTKPVDIPNGKLVIDHYGRKCIAKLQDMDSNKVPCPDGVFTMQVEMSYLRKTKDGGFCPVWRGGNDIESLNKIFLNNGLKLVSVVSAVPGVAVREKKVHIYNIFTLNAKVEIVDVETWKEAFVGGLGQRISYGFGQVELK